MDYAVKKWSHALNCWVLDTPTYNPRENDGKYWDAKLGAWVVDPAQADCTKDDKPNLTRQISDIGAKKGLETGKKKIEEIPAPQDKSPKEQKSLAPSSSYSKYKPLYPWEGIEYKKYPATFMKLLLLYFTSDWYRMGPWVSEEEYKERLKGVYREKTKSTQSTPYYSRFNNDWE